MRKFWEISLISRKDFFGDVFKNPVAEDETRVGDK
jgi:hypothetical protein